MQGLSMIRKVLMSVLIGVALLGSFGMVLVQYAQAPLKTPLDVPVSRIVSGTLAAGAVSSKIDYYPSTVISGRLFNFKLSCSGEFLASFPFLVTEGVAREILDFGAYMTVTNTDIPTGPVLIQSSWADTDIFASTIVSLDLDAGDGGTQGCVLRDTATTTNDDGWEIINTHPTGTVNFQLILIYP